MGFCIAPLSHKSLKYLLSILSKRGEMGNELGKLISSNQGKIEGLIPSEYQTNAEDYLSSGWSEKTDPEKYISEQNSNPEKYDILYRIINNYFKKKQNGLLLVEEPILRKGHAELEHLSKKVFISDRPYFFSDRNDLSEKSLGQIFDDAKTAVGSFGILTTLPKEDSLHIVDGHTLSQTELNNLVIRSEIVWIDAFDAEGFVVWTRL